MNSTQTQVQLKYTTLIEMGAQIIGPMIDENPDIGFAELADILNARGYRNSRGHLVNKNSISWALQHAFPDQRYRRRDKCSKKSYAEREAKTNLKLVQDLDPTGVYVEPVHHSIAENVSRPTTTRSVVDSDAPSPVSAKEVVETKLDGVEAELFWESERAQLDVTAEVPLPTAAVKAPLLTRFLNLLRRLFSF